MPEIPIASRMFRRRRWLLGALALVLACVGVWWWREAHTTLRVIGHYACYQDAFRWNCPRGFVYTDTQKALADTLPCPLVFRDWEGRVQWRVTLPATGEGSGIVKPDSSELKRAMAISPDGHYLAVAYRQGASVVVTTWHDGKQSGQVTLPRAWFPDARRELAVTDSGRVFLYCDAVATPIFVIEADKVIATGHHRSKLPAIDSVFSSTNWRSVIKDGTLLVSNFYLYTSRENRCYAEYATLRIIGNRLEVSSSYLVANEYFFLMFPDGRVAGFHESEWWDGKIHLWDAAGCGAYWKLTGIQRQLGSREAIELFDVQVRWNCTDNQISVPAAIENLWIPCSRQGKLILYNPMTREFRPQQFIQDNLHDLQDISSDGNYLLTEEESPLQASMKRGLWQRLSSIPAVATMEKDLGSPSALIAIYRNPGQCCARAALPQHLFNETYLFQGMFSPDSHHVLVKVRYAHKGPSPMKEELLLYRW